MQKSLGFIVPRIYANCDPEQPRTHKKKGRKLVERDKCSMETNGKLLRVRKRSKK